MLELLIPRICIPAFSMNSTQVPSAQSHKRLEKRLCHSPSSRKGKKKSRKSTPSGSLCQAPPAVLQQKILSAYLKITIFWTAFTNNLKARSLFRSYPRHWGNTETLLRFGRHEPLQLYGTNSTGPHLGSTKQLLTTECSAVLLLEDCPTNLNIFQVWSISSATTQLTTLQISHWPVLR